MTGFYLALLAMLLSGTGSRDQMAVAQLSLRQGARPAVLITGLLIACATAGFAAWAAWLIAPMLVPKARLILAALALAFAGGESVLIGPARKPREPTWSLPALAFVLLYHQMTDAARFLLFGIAVAANAPIPVGIAGAVGGCALLFAGWQAPQAVTHPGLRMARRVIGALLLLLAAYVALRAFGRA